MGCTLRCPETCRVRTRRTPHACSVLDSQSASHPSNELGPEFIGELLGAAGAEEHVGGQTQLDLVNREIGQVALTSDRGVLEALGHQLEGLLERLGREAERVVLLLVLRLDDHFADAELAAATRMLWMLPPAIWKRSAKTSRSMLRSQWSCDGSACSHSRRRASPSGSGKFMMKRSRRVNASSMLLRRLVVRIEIPSNDSNRCSR